MGGNFWPVLSPTAPPQRIHSFYSGADGAVLEVTRTALLRWRRDEPPWRTGGGAPTSSWSRCAPAAVLTAAGSRGAPRSSNCACAPWKLTVSPDCHGVEFSEHDPELLHRKQTAGQAARSSRSRPVWRAIPGLPSRSRSSTGPGSRGCTRGSRRRTRRPRRSGRRSSRWGSGYRPDQSRRRSRRRVAGLADEPVGDDRTEPAFLDNGK